MSLEPVELARWTRFAAKGGIGKGTAKCDCVAESSDDLMFMKVCCLWDMILLLSAPNLMERISSCSMLNFLAILTVLFLGSG
jgi:hypothetical protein